MAIEVAKIELKTVQDASGLEACIADGQFAADEVIAVIGKTEGNGGVNDFTRILADQAFRRVLHQARQARRGRDRGHPDGLVGRLRRRHHAACHGVRARTARPARRRNRGLRSAPR